MAAAAQQLPPSRPPLPGPASSQVSLSASSTGYAASGQPDYRTPPVRVPLNGTTSPAASIDSARSANQAALRRLAGSNKSQDSVAASLTARSDDGSSGPPRSWNGTVNGSGVSLLAESPVSEEKLPPERRRPPMDPTRPQGAADDGLVPAPLSSMRSRDAVIPPPRSSERMSPRKASAGSRSETGSLYDRSTPAPETKPDVPIKSPMNGSFTTMSSTSPTALDSTVDSPVDIEQESRPGLGPMIKKKSKGDIAGAFRKAAAAATVFKPRPGGAGDRLRQAQTKSNDGPDGITGVVPAPPRPKSIEKPKSLSEERPKTPQRTSGIPEVKVTVPQSSRPSSIQASIKESIKQPQPQPEPEADNRRSIIAGNDAKYLSALGLDPSMLDNPASNSPNGWTISVGSPGRRCGRETSKT